MIITWESGEPVVREPEAGDEPTPETVEAWRLRVKAPSFNLIRMMMRLAIDGSHRGEAASMWSVVVTPLKADALIWDSWTTAALIDRNPASEQGASDIIVDTIYAAVPEPFGDEAARIERANQIADLVWRIAMVAAVTPSLAVINPIIDAFNAE